MLGDLSEPALSLMPKELTKALLKKGILEEVMLVKSLKMVATPFGKDDADVCANAEC